MSSYRVYFRTEIQWTVRSFTASSPEAALRLARRFAGEHPERLEFSDYEGCDCPINRIEVLDRDGNEVASWCDDDLRVRLAGADLLHAGELVIARWESGDLAEAVRELAAAVAKAKGTG